MGVKHGGLVAENVDMEGKHWEMWVKHEEMGGETWKYGRETLGYGTWNVEIWKGNYGEWVYERKNVEMGGEHGISI